MSDTAGRWTQKTLEGDDVNITHRQCEMEPVCTNPATYEVETLVYDGTAQVYADIPACDTCTENVTYPDDPSDSDLARRLRRIERLTVPDE